MMPRNEIDLKEEIEIKMREYYLSLVDILRALYF